MVEAFFNGGAGGFSLASFFGGGSGGAGGFSFFRRDNIGPFSIDAMAGRTFGSKLSFVRICVAVGTLCERKWCEGGDSLFGGVRFVAVCTANFLVETFEGVVGFGMIKLHFSGHFLPIFNARSVALVTVEEVFS